MIVVSIKYNICLQTEAKWKSKVAEYGNTQVRYKLLKIVLKYSTRVNVLRYIPSLVLAAAAKTSSDKPAVC